MSVAERVAARHVPTTADEYHAESEHDSSSTLRVFEDSPAEYYHRRVTGRIKRKPTTDDQRAGTAVHSGLLEPETLWRSVLPIPVEVLSKSGAKAGGKWEEWRDAHPGTIHVKQEEFDLMRWQVGAVWENPRCADVLRAATAKEHNIFWEGEIPLKCRLDAVAELDAVVTDLKSTRLSEDHFWRSVRDYRYHRQAATYCTGFEALYGAWPAFQFLLVRDEPPFDCCVRTMPAAMLDLGRRENEDTIRKLAACRRGERPWVKDGALEIKELSVPLYFYPATDDCPEV